MGTKNVNSTKPHPAAAARMERDSTAERSQSNQNKRGVQLMREGKFTEAIGVLRSLVIPPGCTWMRPDAPKLFKRNFATALLLAGHPSGCLELLAEMRDEDHPRVKQLRLAVRRWERTLSFLQWLNWRTGWIEPENRPVSIDFVPGELEGELLLPDATAGGAAASNLSTAV